MPNGTYQLRDGRQVRFRSLSVTRNHDGMLAGSTETGSKRILEMLQAEARQIRPPQSPLLVIVPEKLPLPNYMWTAELEAQRAVRTDDPDFGSHLSVCWFADDLGQDINAVIATQLLSVDWDERATDYDTTLF